MTMSLPGIKLVRGENIGQVLQFAQSGNVDAAFLARSQWLDQKLKMSGKSIEIPSSLHEPLKQQAVLLTRAVNSKNTRAFMRFLAGDQAKTIFTKNYGYDVPGNTGAATTSALWTGNR